MFLSRTPLLPPRAGTTTRIRLPPSIDASRAYRFDDLLDLRQALHHDDVASVERLAPEADERAPAEPGSVEVGGAVADHDHRRRREALASHDLSKIFRLGPRPAEHGTKVSVPAPALDDPPERDLRRRRVHIQGVARRQPPKQVRSTIHLPAGSGEILADRVVAIGAFRHETLDVRGRRSPIG